MFEKFFKRSNWTDITIAFVFVLLGALLMLKPDEMMSVLSILLGAVFIIIGFLKLVDYFTSEDKEDYLLTMAIVFVIMGAIMILSPNIISNLFTIVLGIWIIAAGLRNFQTTLIWKEVKSAYWTIALVFSLLTIIAGIAILASNTLAVQVIGIFIAIYAILDIMTKMIFMKKIKDYLKED